MRRLLLSGSVLLLMLAGSAAPAQDSTPQAGNGQNDPYLWLEEIDSPRAMAWVEAENKRTLGILHGDPRYAGLYADALKIVEATDKIPAPGLIGGQVVNFWQDAAHVQGIWRITTPQSYATATPAWRTLIDLDALAATDKTKWVWKGVNCDNGETRCMIELSDGGEDATTEREFDMKTGRFVEGGFTLPRSKQSVAWEGTTSLLLARDWGAGTMTKSGYPFVVKRLGRGQPLSTAKELFRGQADDVGAFPFSAVDAQGRKVSLFLRATSFFDTDYYLDTPQGPKKIDVSTKTDIAGFIDGRLIFRLNEDWAMTSGTIAAGAIIAVDPWGKAPPETVFVPSARQGVDSLSVTKSHVLATVYDNVRGRAIRFTHGAKGWTAQSLGLPDNSTVDVAAASTLGDAVYLSVTNFLTPTTLWSGDLATGAVRQIKTLPPRFDATGLVTEQFEVASKDGTKVPYFVTHRRDIPYDGTTPTLLNAYGGFQVSETPAYNSLVGKLWLERGGAFALANIRGGGEFGPAWHQAALKTKRQVAYDDFAAVGRDLIARKITSSRRLGIYGGSNGGLLMGVEMTQNPALWNGVAIEIPLLDMLRYEQLSAGASWVGEYGSVSVPAERDFLAGISPYNNLKRGVPYPEPFIWTTTKDDRVGPVQARKFAARMKEFGLPYLYWENTAGGHGAGSNLKEQAETKSLEITYFIRRLMDKEVPVDPAP